MPIYRISEESARKGRAANSVWLDVVLKLNPHLTGMNLAAYMDYGSQGFEAAWKFRDMVNDLGFEGAMARMQAELEDKEKD